MNREALIEKAAKAMYFEDCGVAALEDDAEPFRDMARVSLAVFEEAHTPANVSEPGKMDIPSAQVSTSGQIPTDDEREVIAQVILPAFDQLACAVYADGPYSEAESALEAVDLLIAAGFHRTVQGEPSAAAVEAACVGFYEHATKLTSWARLAETDPTLADVYRGGMRAALRAASAVQGGEN